MVVSSLMLLALAKFFDPVSHAASFGTRSAVYAWAAGIELMLAGLLLTRRWRAAAWATVLLMLAFMVGANRNLFPECGCLGAWFRIGMHGRVAVACALGLCAVLAIHTDPRRKLLDA